MGSSQSNQVLVKFTSPPVVQFKDKNSFFISIGVSGRCTARVEWGTSDDQLSEIAQPIFGGLVITDDHCLVIPIDFSNFQPAPKTIYYRVVGVPMTYHNAYEIEKGPEIQTSTRELVLPQRSSTRLSMAIVNDTHDVKTVIPILSEIIQQAQPDMLVWNGDVCREFNDEEDLPSILLSPGASPSDPSEGGWASERPLLFVPGNHDVRGVRAPQLPSIFPPGPDPLLPYNKSLRLGPLALVTLDAGEDKPDGHPVFSGTAAYEAYRKRQTIWLKEQLQTEKISSAPFKLAFCHIPLIGMPGDHDGTQLEGHAGFSGEGARLWLPLLTEAGFHGIVSGHTHDVRFTNPSEECSLFQTVGGGPGPKTAAVILMDVTETSLSIEILDLNRKVLIKETLS